MTSLTQPRVCISLLNWKHVETTLDCLKTLQSLTYSAYNVVVVDNASGNESVARLSAAYPDLKVIEAESNLGYAGGNALSLDYARSINAELLWILNPDAFPAPDALDKLVDAYQRFGLALYGSITVEQREGRSWVFQRRWGFNQQHLPDPAHRETLSGPVDQVFADLASQQSATLSGSSLLIPMALIDQYGFIDTSFFLYSEESDYSARLYREGIPSYLVPASQVYHNLQGAHKHHRPLKGVILYYQVRNRLTVARRYSSRAFYLWTVLQHLAYIAAAYVLIPLKGLQSARTGRWMWRGWWDAVQGRMGLTYRPEDYLDAN